MIGEPLEKSLTKMSGIVTKKLKFKGDKPKKKKRTREAVDEGDELAAMAAGDPSGASYLASSYLEAGRGNMCARTTAGILKGPAQGLMMQNGSFPKAQTRSPDRHSSSCLPNRLPV